MQALTPPTPMLQPPLKAMAMPEASSTAIIAAGGCASHRSSQRRCLAWPCRCGNSSWMRSTLANPPRVLRELGRGEMNFRCHTWVKRLAIGSSVMASPLLEIKPGADWAQHTAHRTGSRPSLIFRATAHLEIGAMTCWRPPRHGLGGEPQPAAPRASKKRMHVAKKT